MALILDAVFRTVKAERDLDSFVRKSKTSVASLEKNSVSGATRISSAFSSASKVIGALGLGAAALEVAQFTKRSIELASALQEAQNRFDVVFQGVSGATQQVNAMAQAVGRSRKEWIEFTGALGDVLKPLGFTTQEAFALSTQLTKLSVDVASFTNAADADVLRSFESAIVGNTEALRSYGIAINAADVKAEAYSAGIATQGEELTKTQKALATYNLIFKNTIDAQGDAAKTQDSYANQTKRLQSNFEELTLVIGGAFLPVATEGIKELNTDLEDLLRNSDRIKKSFSDAWKTVGSSIGGAIEPTEDIRKALEEYDKQQRAAANATVHGWIGVKSTLSAVKDLQISANKDTQQSIEDVIDSIKKRIRAEADATAQVIQSQTQVDELNKRYAKLTVTAATRSFVEADLDKIGKSQTENAEARLNYAVRQVLLLQEMGASQELITKEMQKQVQETNRTLFTMELIPTPQAEIERYTQSTARNLTYWNPELERARLLSYEIGDAIFSHVGAALNSAIDKAIRMRGVMGDILRDVAKLLIKLGINALASSVGLPGLFHKGGVVPGFPTGGVVRPNQGAPIGGIDNRIVSVQVGEGILTRETTQRLGGERGIKALNAGASPSVTFGNIIINANTFDRRFVETDLLPTLEKIARQGRFTVPANRLVRR